jgi:hypothetical protein
MASATILEKGHRMMGSSLAPRLVAAFLSAFLLSGGAGPAMGAGEAVLTIAGLGGADGAEVNLTVEQLREMGDDEIRTGTPWTEGESTFTGVTGRRLVEALQAAGAEVTGSAINDYHTIIPFEVFDSDSLLLAYAQDGQPMSVREKGPLWIVFPFDDDPMYRSDTYKAYAIWSLTRLEFR